MLVTFGGMAGGDDTTVFEFGRMTEDLGVHRIMVRDHERSWYHRGVRGVGEGIDEVADALEVLIAQAAPERVVMIGASAGGYAAMLFGDRLGADATHAFAPQTFVSPGSRTRRREHRWQQELDGLIASGRFDARFGDLAEALPLGPNSTEHNLWYSPVEASDVPHAAVAAAIPGVVLHCIPEGGHLVVKWLKQHDYLTSVISASLDGQPARRLDVETDPVLFAATPRSYILRQRWRRTKNKTLQRLGVRDITYQ